MTDTMSDDEYDAWYQRTFNPDDARRARRQVSQPAPASMTQQWVAYIRQEIRKNERGLMNAIAGAIVAEEREREKVAAETAMLRATIDELKRELEALRTEIGTAKRLEDLQERIDRLETPRGTSQPLRAV